ncbi:MAG: serine--tRNA ligase [Elusimicrobiales bacterium]|nr:serine--tRNA ligase [Elusimicrobiales bacterium]
MIDLRLLRSNPDFFREAMSVRSGDYGPALEELVEKDARYRALLTEVETLRGKSKTISAEVGKFRAQKQEVPPELQKQAGELKEALRAKEESLAPKEAEIKNLALCLPNPAHESVPVGKSEADNKPVRENAEHKPQFNFKPRDHHELGEKLGILDFQTAALLSGSRFALLRGAGARLERAIISFFLDMHTKRHGYKEIMPPYIVTGETLTGTGQLPKFEEDLYKVAAEPPLYMIPTAEVPVTNMYRGATLKESQLPMKFASYTACFRQEAGSYGKDTRGLIRQHQFNKVELVWLAKPEESMTALEQLTRDAEAVLDALGLAHRVILLCTGDTGFASCKTYDVEVWLPSENRYREISSCSNCRDFQARRMNTRFKREKGGSPEFVHTLNGSGVAVGRTFAAILENFQNEDGTVTVPLALRPYFGADKIVPEAAA